MFKRGDLVLYTPDDRCQGEEKKSYLGLILDSCPTWVDVFWCGLNDVQRFSTGWSSKEKKHWEVINETG